MAGDRNVCPVSDAPYIEPQMDGKPLERQLYTAANLADTAGSSGIALYDRVNGERHHPFPPRPFLPADKRPAILCQKPAYGFCLLGICVDVPPSGTPLEHDDGNGQERISWYLAHPYMDTAYSGGGNRGLRHLCFCSTGYGKLYVPENPVCIL